MGDGTPSLSVCFHPGMVIADPALAQIPNGGYFNEESSCQLACQQRGSTCAMWTWKEVGNVFKGVLPGGCWLKGEGAQLQSTSESGDNGNVVSGPQYCPTLAPWPPSATSAPASATSAPPAVTTPAPAGITTLAPAGIATLAPGGIATLAPGGIGAGLATLAPTLPAIPTLAPKGIATLAPPLPAIAAPAGITTLAPGGIATLPPPGGATLAPSATLVPSATSAPPVTAPPLIVTTTGVGFNGTVAGINGTNSTENVTLPGGMTGGGGFPWWSIVLVIAGIALLVGLALYLCGGEGQKVSKKKKKSKRTAEARMEDGQEAQPLVESRLPEPVVGQPAAGQMPQQAAPAAAGLPSAGQVPQQPTPLMPQQGPQPPMPPMPQQAVPGMPVGQYQAGYMQPPVYSFGPGARQPQFVVR